jgi:hypothetical protein
MPEQSLPPSVVAAVIGVAGTMAVATLTWVGREVAHMLAERREMKELLPALHAEISNKLQISEFAFGNYSIDEICNRMRENSSYQPFVTLEPYSSPIFDTAKKDIRKLRAPVIKPIIEFYSWDRSMHAAFEKLNTDEVKQLDVERRMLLFRDAGQIWKMHIISAKAAISAIENKGM